MNIAVILGTRPEIIRLYHIVKLLKNKTIYFTGQNFEPCLSTDIFNDLLLRDAYLDIVNLNIGTNYDFGTQFSKLVLSIDQALEINKPSKVLILGDTNSALAAAIVAKKKGIPVYHMEAGNRCFDPSSPEEINRKLIDSIADVHLCYTKFAKQNLLVEGVPQNKIHVIGNPIAEFTELYSGVKEGLYVLLTAHRQENKKYLDNIIKYAEMLVYNGVPIKLKIHPRYYEYFKKFDLDVGLSVSFSEFLELEKNASLIVTDSGTVCEEAAILNKPCIVIRRTMERPELLELGNTILVPPINAEELYDISSTLIKRKTINEIPEEYKYQKVSEKVATILMGYKNEY